MTKPTTAPGTNGPATQTREKKPLVPPDEKFWQKYSPHHEAPLSGASSMFLHLACIGLITLLAIWYSRHHAEADKPLFLDAITAGEPAGGGGDPNGAADGAGKVARAENVEENPAKVPESSKPTPAPKQTLTDVTIDPLETPTIQEPDSRLVVDAKGKVEETERMTKQFREQLFKNLGSNKQANNKGGGGRGAGGGKGDGVGTGDGPGTGIGGNLDVRTKRILRWTLMFNTLNGDDYRKQLSALGAILAVPEPSGEFRVYRNLTPPVTGQIEDITKINRIFWVDDKPESVRSLSMALGLNPVPAQIVAFFPKELEQELLRLELKYRGLKEHQIRETRFNVVRRGSGYVPVVVTQR